MVVSIKEKAQKKMCQVGSEKVSDKRTIGSIVSFSKVSKLENVPISEINPRATCLLLGWHPV